MATHSSIPAWRIPGTEEPGRLTVHGVTKSWTRLSDFTSPIVFWCTQPSNSRVYLKVLAAQSCLTLCDPMECSPPGSFAMGFSRQECWSGLPCLPPGDLPDPGMRILCLLHWQAGSLPLAPSGKPQSSVEDNC